MEHSMSLSLRGRHWSLRWRWRGFSRVTERRELHGERAPEIYKGVSFSLWLKMNLHTQRARSHEVLQKTGIGGLWMELRFWRSPKAGRQNSDQS